LKKILLAGSSGIIGTFLKSFFEGDYRIYTLQKNKIHSKRQNIDLRNLNEVESFVEKSPKFDFLIFLVGLAHNKGRKNDLHHFMEVNRNTLINLISVLKDKKNFSGKIIFASTISIYGESLNESIYSEEKIPKPITPYARTKLKAEEYLLKLYLKESWVLRLAPVYSKEFLLNINRRTVFKKLPYRVGKGDKKLSLCNIENIGVVINIILKNQIPFGVYNISDEISYTYNDLLKFKRHRIIIPIPNFIIEALYYIGKKTNNYFLMENSVKLLSDNLYPSNKIRLYASLKSKLVNKS
jgi:UDP-glucose 4-epimerase